MELARPQNGSTSCLSYQMFIFVVIWFLTSSGSTTPSWVKLKHGFYCQWLLESYPLTFPWKKASAWQDGEWISLKGGYHKVYHPILYYPYIYIYWIHNFAVHPFLDITIFIYSLYRNQAENNNQKYHSKCTDWANEKNRHVADKPLWLLLVE